MEGTRILSTDEFKNAGMYVLVANDDPFIKAHYNKMFIPRLTTTAVGLNGYSFKNDFVKMIRPITQRRVKRLGTDGHDESGGEGPTRLRTANNNIKKDMSRKELELKKVLSRKELEKEDMNTESEEDSKPITRGKCKIQSLVHPIAARAKTPKVMEEEKEELEEMERTQSTSSLVPILKPKTPVFVSEEEEEEAPFREVTPKPRTPANEKRAKTPIEAVNEEREKTKSYKELQDSQNGNGSEKGTPDLQWIVKFVENRSRSNSLSRKDLNTPNGGTIHFLTL